ncbi:helix-turn-helix domain-containing protein [Ferrovibrio sp.]|uniref:helix-turn-helix domain-containing protein n=1 Tax=Ferrovibrio sp. TaxID=1917215 RepID=UPI0035B49F62
MNQLPRTKLVKSADASTNTGVQPVQGSHVDLGSRVRGIRQSKRMTLKDVANRSGLAVATLSKVENNRLSPTYENIIRLARGLDVDIAVLFSDQPQLSPHGRRSITRLGQGKVFETETYNYEMLCTDVVGKRIIPLKARIKQREWKDFSPLIKHEGEEVIYVLTGRIRLITEFYEEVILEPGDCVYFDSTMGHVCLAHGLEDAEVFWVCSSSDAINVVENSHESARPRSK